MERARSLSISVVIPVRDDGERLERCLERLQRQTEPPFEIVVVDNGSSDLTPVVAAWWGARCIGEREPGIPAASSAGYDAARGDIIARLDADSEPPPDWLHRVRRAFEDDPELTAVTGPGTFDSAPPVLQGLIGLGYMRAYFAVFGDILHRVPLFGSNFAMRRDAWIVAREGVHRHDARVHDDLDLSCNLDPASRVRYEPTLTVHVSSRPFANPFAFVWRAWRGVHTLLVNRESLPRQL
jgi:glycosyltransferase involved in cell wall biosynthesis